MKLINLPGVLFEGWEGIVDSAPGSNTALIIW
jgi:hypothetical protein